jgi:hypothetical protein
MASRFGSFCAVATALVVFASVAGCKRGASGRAAPAPSASAAATEPQVDAALLGELTRLAQVCDVDLADANVNCKGGENHKLVTEFVSDQRSRIAALPTMTRALKDSNPRVQTTAANVLYSVFRAQLGPDARVGAVAPPDAKALVGAVVSLPPAAARQAVPTAVHAAMLAQSPDVLYQALDEPRNAQLATVANRHLMTYGRLAAFAKVKELSKSPNSALVLAALDSPSTMPNWSGSEQAEICPWAQSFLRDDRPAIAAKAAGLMTNCGGEYVDKLLDEGERLVKDKRLTRAHLVPFRELCSAAHAGTESATAEQCRRNRKFLERLARAGDVEPPTRALALSSIAFQWPDEQALDLAASFGSDKNAALSEASREIAQRLEQRGVKKVRKR